MTDSSFDDLVTAAERQSFSGWDFSYLQGRVRWGSVSWDYPTLVRERLSGVDAMLDMGTGGGELLSSLAPLPPLTVATEAYFPNVSVARTRLEPLGVEVVAIDGTPQNVHIVPGSGIRNLPFRDAYFPLVINRHESYFPDEVHRILRPGGRLLTQQVGGLHNRELNLALGAPVDDGPVWDLVFARRQLEEAGLLIVEGQEEHPETVFLDIGAVAHFLKAVPWQIRDFSVERYRDRLAALHERMVADGGLSVQEHLFYVEVVRPRSPEGGQYRR